MFPFPFGMLGVNNISKSICISSVIVRLFGQRAEEKVVEE
jgi:hypothetical protein